MAAKNKAQDKMNGTEFALNRPLLREMNQKLKTFSNYDGAGSLQSGQNWHLFSDKSDTPKKSIFQISANK